VAASERDPARELNARTADKYRLYELSVQDGTVELDFVERAFRRFRGRLPELLREDFCGSALVSAAWASRGGRRRAIGVDLDARVLAWGRRNNLAPLGEAAARVRLVRRDVRNPPPAQVDAALALNFSYWVFKTRDQMRGYFRSVRRSLARDGALFLDVYGGWEAQEPMTDRRSVKRRFTYEWEQELFDPITHRVVNHIHFSFRDGSRIERAFSYDWRYWSIPELTELLTEAGFARTVVYWDRSDTDDEEDFRPTKSATNHPGWLAYLVALR
jgi:SAM-dependent methyltransferase